MINFAGALGLLLGCHIHCARHIRRIERSSWAEKSARAEAGHSAVAARDHVEPIDEEVRVNGSARWQARTCADEQCAHCIIASLIVHGGPHLVRGSTRHPPDMTS